MAIQQTGLDPAVIMEKLGQLGFSKEAVKQFLDVFDVPPSFTAILGICLEVRQLIPSLRALIEEDGTAVLDMWDRLAKTLISLPEVHRDPLASKRTTAQTPTLRTRDENLYEDHPLYVFLGHPSSDIDRAERHKVLRAAVWLAALNARWRQGGKWPRYQLALARDIGKVKHAAHRDWLDSCPSRPRSLEEVLAALDEFLVDADHDTAGLAEIRAVRKIFAYGLGLQQPSGPRRTPRGQSGGGEVRGGYHPFDSPPSVANLQLVTRIVDDLTGTEVRMLAGGEHMTPEDGPHSPTPTERAGASPFDVVPRADLMLVRASGKVSVISRLLAHLQADAIAGSRVGFVYGIDVASAPEIAAWLELALRKEAVASKEAHWGAFAALVLWTGREAPFARQCLVELAGAAPPNTVPILDLARGVMHLSIPSPHADDDLSPRAVREARMVVETLVATMPPLLRRHLSVCQPLLDLEFIRRHDEIQFTTETNRMFQRLRILSANSLSVGRLRRVLSSALCGLPGADSVAALLLTDTADLLDNQFAYTAVPLAELASAYDRAISAIETAVLNESEVVRNSKIHLSSPTAIPVDPAMHCGSRYVPLPETVKRHVAGLIAEVEAARATQDIVRFHNAYATYTYLMLAFGTGLRATAWPLTLPFEFDPTSQGMLVSDKDAADYHGCRLCWLPELVALQLQAFALHVDALSERLGLLDAAAARSMRAQEPFPSLSVNRDRALAMLRVKPTRSRRSRGNAVADAAGEGTTRMRRIPFLFWLGDDAVPREFRPKVFYRQFWQPFTDLPVNASRHYFRTELALASCPTDAIDAAMGHWNRGLEPYGRFGTLAPALVKHHVLPIIDRVLERDGWVHIDSELAHPYAKLPWVWSKSAIRGRDAEKKR